MNEPLIRLKRNAQEIKILARKDGHTVWARRMPDGALGDYWHSEITCDQGVDAFQRLIAPMPILRRATAQRRAAELNTQAGLT